MRQITKEEMELLLDNQIILNTSKGYRNKSGVEVGFYRTRNKRYIEDKYVEIAKKISN